MQDTLLAIILLCDADRMAKLTKLAELANEWTVGDCIRRYDQGGYERDYQHELETQAEIEARTIGHEKGIRFRVYRHWGSYPIKAYERRPGAGSTEAPDFRTWEEAREWIQGQ